MSWVTGRKGCIQMHGTRLAGIGVAAVSAIALAAAPAIASGGFSGTEHFTFETTATGNSDHFSALLTGAFVDGGTAILPGKGKGGTLELRKGKIYAMPTSKGKAKSTENKQECFFSYSQSGDVKLTGGTGAYAGITGHGSYHEVYSGVGPFKGGKCDTRANAVAAQGVISGTLTLG